VDSQILITDTIGTQRVTFSADLKAVDGKLANMNKVNVPLSNEVHGQVVPEVQNAVAINYTFATMLHTIHQDIDASAARPFATFVFSIGARGLAAEAPI
jgi:hypothetical protein